MVTKKSIVFQNPEKELISFVSNILEKNSAGRGWEDFKVTVKRTPYHQQSDGEKTIVIRSEGGPVTENYLKEDDINILVFLSDGDGFEKNRGETYKNIQELSDFIAANLRLVVYKSLNIKYVTHGEVITVEDENNLQVRQINFAATICGKLSNVVI